MYTFKDIEQWLRIFQCGWYIDDNNYLRIEHRKYFDLGLSYTSNVSDMTISEKILEKVTYSTETPQAEELEFAYSNGVDFVGVPIRYYGNVVNRDEGVGNVKESIGKLSTDLTYVTSNQDAVGNDGFLLAATAIIGNGELWVTRANGVITGELLENGYLSTANLMDYYWKW